MMSGINTSSPRSVRPSVTRPARPNNNVSAGSPVQVKLDTGPGHILGTDALAREPESLASAPGRSASVTKAFGEIADQVLEGPQEGTPPTRNMVIPSHLTSGGTSDVEANYGGDLSEHVGGDDRFLEERELLTLPGTSLRTPFGNYSSQHSFGVAPTVAGRFGADFRSTPDEWHSSAGIDLAAQGAVYAQRSFNLSRGQSEMNLDVTGSYGPGASVQAISELSRRPGQTDIRIAGGGSFMAGFNVDFNTSIHDRDIAESVTQPMEIADDTLESVGEATEDLGDAVGHVQQQTQQAGDVLHAMSLSPTTDPITRSALSAAEGVTQLVTTGLMGFSFGANQLGSQIDGAGELVNAVHDVTTDRLEADITETIQRQVRNAHAGWQAAAGMMVEDPTVTYNDEGQRDPSEIYPQPALVR